MNINLRPAAAEEWADDNFASMRMRHRENGRLYARKLHSKITRRQLASPTGTLWSSYTASNCIN